MNILSALMLGALVAGGTSPQPASCVAQVGHETASVYVQDCMMNTMSTHPPCNEANPCSMIVAEVVRSCDADVPGGAPKPDPQVCLKYRKLLQTYPLQLARSDG
jgi:hypothetical protein